MASHRIRKGLNLPITGEPEARLDQASPPGSVALLAHDFIGMKPTMHVGVGDSVRRGQLLFEDKKTPQVRYTAPASGQVSAVNRGERRALQSVVIRLDSDELSGSGESVAFSTYTGRHPSELSRDEVKDLLIESGLWIALRQRPYSKVANPETTPKSIFVTAMDSHPLAPPANLILQGREADFRRGAEALAKLTDGTVYVCKAPDTSITLSQNGQLRIEDFQGPHPSGTSGVHIHWLDPVDRNKLVWWAGLQDVIAIGKLFSTGQLDVRRVIALAGPSVERPRLLQTRLGASTDDLTERELSPGKQRVISGSVLTGAAASGNVFGYLGRYHQQISVLPEGEQRDFLGWMSPGFQLFSTINSVASRILPGKKFRFTTSTNGSDRAMVPIGMYERVMPMDLMPTPLLRALLMKDVEKAEELGALELDEEDLGLCSFVCPGKVEYGPLLRDVLTTAEKEG